MLAILCQVKLLEPGVIRRVLQQDGSACGAPNAKGFAKPHDLFLLHLAMRERSLDSFGPAQTAAMENDVVERLRTPAPTLERLATRISIDAAIVPGMGG